MTRWFHMLAKEHPKKIKINITTYTKPKRKYNLEMDNKSCDSRKDNSRFICSICLNSNARKEELNNMECDRRKSKSCPMCQKTDTTMELYEKVNKNDEKKHVNNGRIKNVLASKVNVDQGLNLLTEVLTVFQSQKENSGKERNNKSILLKDASVSAEFGKSKPKLAVSKTFQLSIGGGGIQESGKFYLVNAYQPEIVKNSQCSLDLIKHKSSSIPQMKMDELKNSLKEKTKTNKDAIEEVNRMFATVKRDDNFDNINRPMTRNGPRILPFVKTSLQRQSDEDSSIQTQEFCRCCQKSQNYYLSGGDSLVKKERCDKTANVECCNKSHGCVEEIQICDRCRKPS